MSKYRKLKNIYKMIFTNLISGILLFIMARYTIASMIEIITIWIMIENVLYILLDIARFEPIKKPSSYASKQENLTKVLEKSIF